MRGFAEGVIEMTNADDIAFSSTSGYRQKHGAHGNYFEPTGGLTKREYFAAMAMQNSQYLDPSSQAEFAVRCADALIDALNKPKEDENVDNS